MDFMVFWPRHKFKVLGSVAPGDLWKLHEGHQSAIQFRDAVRDVFDLGSKDEVQGRLF